MKYVTLKTKLKVATFLFSAPQFLRDGSQALPICPSGTNNVEVLNTEGQWNDTDSTRFNTKNSAFGLYFFFLPCNSYSKAVSTWGHSVAGRANGGDCGAIAPY